MVQSLKNQDEPHSSEPWFVVRLDKPDEQILKLIAEKIETTAGVQIKGLTLVPK